MYFELVVCDSVPVMRYEDDGVSAVVIPIIAEVGALEDRVCDSVSAVVEVSEAVKSGVEISCFSLVSSNTVEVGNELSFLSSVIVCSSETGVDGVFDGVVIAGEVFTEVDVLWFSVPGNISVEVEVENEFLILSLVKSITVPSSCVENTVDRR